MYRHQLQFVVSISLLLLTGCPQTPPQMPPAPLPNSGAAANASVASAPPRTAAESTALLRLKNRALGELENNRLADADKHLEELLALESRDPLGYRNLAIARLLAVTTNGVTPEQARWAADQLLAHDQSAKAKWLAGRIGVALAERLPAVDAREAALAEAVKLLKDAADADTANPAFPYGIFEATRYATSPSLQEMAKSALVSAAERAPNNLFLLTELLLQQAESHAEATTASLAHLQKIAGPLREGILRRTRVKIEDYLAAATDGISAGDWKVVLGKCRQLSAVIRPEDRTQADLRELTPHALEFVLADFAPGVCPNVPSPPVGAETKFSIAETTFDVAGLGRIQDAVPVDFDLDGRLEILVLGDRGLRIVSDGINSGLSFEMPLTAEFTGLVAADFDRDAAEAKTQPTTGVCQDADPDVILVGPAGVAVYRNHLAEEGSRQLVAVEQSGGLELVRDVRSAIPGDFDHDGDLDLALATGVGVQIWAQAGPMLFVDISDRTLLPDDGLPALDLIAADWDRDVDLDIVVVGAPQAGYLENLRHGEFRWRELDPEFGQAVVSSAAIVEADGNISWDLAAVGGGSLGISLTTTPERGRNRFLKHVEISQSAVTSLIDGDWNNDGWIDLAGCTPEGIAWFSGGPGGAYTEAATLSLGDVEPTKLTCCDIDLDGDLDLIAVAENRVVLLRNETARSGNWLAVRVRGDFEDKSGKHNQYGIGSLLEVRHADQYQARTITGQVEHFGLGDVATPDSLRVLWTSGVPQVALSPVANQAICERQSLKGSCPYLYTWNGEQFAFYTDLLWAAPLGLQFAEGVLAPDRPWEYLLVPGENLIQRNGQYELRVTEELWEAAYFDQIELLAIDHPADVEVFSNEKVGPPEIAEFRVHTVRQRRTPVAARDQRGRDVLDQVSRSDGVYLQSFDRLFRQGLAETHYLELDLGELGSPQQITLFLTGWIYPTDTSLNVALSQDPTLKGPVPPSISVPDVDGQWQVVRPYMGFPGGKTKTIAVDLSGLFLTNDYRVRIETTQELRWDEAFFSVDDAPSEIRVTPLPLLAADLHYRGFSEMDPQHRSRPDTFDYARVSAIPKWPPMGGRFTRYGDVADLLTKTDDRLVVMSSGDEISLAFGISDQPPPVGWKRDFFLHNVGWDKDADLHTVYGQTVEPLPFQGMGGYPYAPETEPPQTPDYLDYLRSYQTRPAAADRFWRWSPEALNDGP